jgi:2-(1,2-epoxy-1,2-dihydrophenyl)acetyl-CoA isomerase
VADSVRTDLDRGRLTVTIDRPDQRNAVNADVVRAIAEPLLRGLDQSSVASDDSERGAA